MFGKIQPGFIFLHFIEIYIQKSVPTKNVRFSKFYKLKVLYTQHPDQETKTLPTLRSFLVFPSLLHTMLRTRLLKNMIAPIQLYLPGDKSQKQHMRRHREKTKDVTQSLPEAWLQGPAPQWMAQFRTVLWGSWAAGITSRDVPYRIPGWNQPLEFSTLDVTYSFFSS